ncbi:MAG: hypothetical protein GX444_03875 [Myxococcales bacterium]|nr:hypothetical protein [Myxococcales bacterium]
MPTIERRRHDGFSGLGVAWIVAFFVLASLGALVCWHAANRLTTGHDSQTHLMTTIRFAAALQTDWRAFADLIVGQSVRYLPLTYLLGASASLLAPTFYGSYLLPIVWFYLLTLLALSVIGISLGRRSFAALLPLTVFLANPISWGVGFSYNLEAGVLAAASVILAVLLVGAEIKNRLIMVLGFFLVGVLSLTKAVVLLPLAPAAIYLAVAGSAEARRVRRLSCAALFLFAGLWLLFRYDTIFAELKGVAFDYAWLSGEPRPALLYYPRILLVEYRGLPLFAGLLALLFVRAREKRLNETDYALALFFLVPFVFFMAVPTQWPWFPLAAFLGLPVWLLHNAMDLWDRRWARRLSLGLVGLYSGLALLNIGLVTTMSFRPIAGHRFKVMELWKPKPPTPAEKELVGFFIAQATSHPERRLTIDLQNAPIGRHRFGDLLYLAAPRLAINHQVVFTETLHPGNRVFAAALPQSSVFYTFGDAWPVVPLAGDAAADPEWAEFVRLIEDTSGLFPEKETIALADGLRVTAYYHREMARTFRKESEADFYREPIGEDWYARLREKGMAAFNAGRYAEAAAYLRIVYRHGRDGDDDEVRYRLALSLASADREADAAPVWDEFFRHGRSFGQQVQALEQLAILAGTGKVAPELFDRYRADLEARHSADRLERYTLRSLTVFAAQQKKDWPAALSAVSALRETLISEQIPGVNLVEAQILRELKEYAAAEKLLTENLHATIKDEVFANSAQELARLQAGQGRLAAAKESLALSFTAPFDANAAVNTILIVDRKIAVVESAENAIRFLRENLSRVPDADTALLYVELGNLRLSGGDRAAAKEAFQEADKRTKDEKLRAWLRTSLTE